MIFPKNALDITYRKVPPLPIMLLLIHLGGANVTEGITFNNLREYCPMQSAILKRNYASEWTNLGIVDAAIFYFMNPNDPQTLRLHKLLQSAEQLRGFYSPVVYSLGKRIVEELKLGNNADLIYIESLKEVMLEECCRVFEMHNDVENLSHNRNLGKLELALNWINNNLNSPLNIQSLADYLGISVPHFKAIFVKTVGVTPYQYALYLRIARVREMLLTTNLSITRIAMQLGFSSQSHLTICFKKSYGMTPAKMRDLLISIK